MKGLKIFGIVCGIIIVLLGVKACNMAVNWGGEAVAVVQQEFSPREIQRKYEWFKNAHAALDAKDQNIKNLIATIEEVNAVPRDQRTDDDNFELRQNRTMLMGLKANFNAMAAEYNAQASKWNWDYFNTGEYPGYERFQGKFKPYL